LAEGERRLQEQAGGYQELLRHRLAEASLNVESLERGNARLETQAHEAMFLEVDRKLGPPKWPR
jgi:DNA-binding PucR family transcriptional regulator